MSTVLFNLSCIYAPPLDACPPPPSSPAFHTALGVRGRRCLLPVFFLLELSQSPCELHICPVASPNTAPSLCVSPEPKGASTRVASAALTPLHCSAINSPSRPIPSSAASSSSS